jgi:hypothetical protein
MNLFPGLLSKVARLAALVTVSVLLAGCMIVSEDELVADSEGAAILPAAAYLTGYDEDGANTFKVSDDGAQPLTLKGGTYTSEDGSLNVRFAPLESVPGKYLMAIVSTDGNMYGVATFKNDILVVEVILGDPKPIDAVNAASDPDLQGITEEEGGLRVTTRTQLDALVQLFLDGKLSLAGLVMYVADDPKAETPARIINDGTEYREE